TQPGTLPKGCPLEPGLAVDELGRRVVGFYQRQLLNRDSRGWQYLASRGLADERLVNRFQLGFAPMGVGGLLRVVPDCQRVAGRQMRSELTVAGWCREVSVKRSGQEFTSSRERLVNCITVPVVDEAGAVVECYGRRTTSRKDNGPLHWYLPGAHRGVWNADACVSADKTVILCEAAFDALSFFVNGMENVTWSYGCSGFTADHLAHFQAFQVQTVIIAYDNDDAGNKAADKLTVELTRHGIGVRRLLPPAGLDINRVAVDAGEDAPEALRALLRDAQWLTDAQPIVPAVIDHSAVDKPVKDTKDNEKPANHAEGVDNSDAFSSLTAAPAGPVLSEPQAPEYVRDGNTVTITRGARTYRLRGLFANKSELALKTTIRASHGEAIFADSVDLYQDRARQRFQRAAAAELELHEDVLRHDTAVVFRVAEDALAAHRADQAAAKAAEAATVPEMTPDERAAALALLRSPDLLNQIAEDVTACGLVGEKVNKLTCYLAATSRLLDDPLGVIIQSSSAAGKSSLMDAVLKMMPDEAVTAYSAMTEQSLFYQGEDALRHQILAIAEEAGAGKIAYSLKILISDHHLTIASPRQNPDTGCFETINYRVNGPTAVLMTTTADDDDLDPELIIRCLLMSVVESADQTA
ncbi:MAG: toprim domain-containing protein, partial [Epibacterium sp.]|nr:toprim domain-containing protein [Epibacterium sp.]NQX75885.1 toprim domain-containing protein [Epibacterium sp.]